MPATTAAVIAATSSSHAHSCGTLVEIPLISLKLLFLAVLVGIAGGAWYGWRLEKDVWCASAYCLVGMATLPFLALLVYSIVYGTIWLFS